MNNLKNKTVADFVVENIATAEVFKKYGINYSYDGTLPLLNLCQEKKVKYQDILAELNSIQTKVPYLKNYNVWDLELLINFLVEIDHPYKLENIIFIENMSKKIDNLYGKELVKFNIINELILKISEIVQTHIKIEESFLFPYIVQLKKFYKENNNLKINKQLLVNPLKNIELEHSSILELWQQLTEQTENYKLFEDVDHNFKVLYIKLKQFEEKLHRHIHIENNILFPKALLLEKQVVES